jgi:hypothetical protein
MKGTVGICALAVLSLSGAPESSAGSLATTFTVATFIGDARTRVEQSIPTPQGKRMMLPSSFASWNCNVTERFFSNDGLRTYHNVTCERVGSDIVFGMSITCPARSEGSFADSFFATTGEATVTFSGTCSTRVSGSAQ